MSADHLPRNSSVSRFARRRSELICAAFSLRAISIFAVAVTLVALQSTTLAAAEDDAAAKPNIVVILVDDMGYGDPGCFNPESKIPTPHIDSLARDGMRFTDAHAPGPLCHMSRYGLMTGRYPFRTDVSRWPTQPLIEPGQMTIASLAKSQGYQTAMVGKWHLGFKENGYDQPLPGGPVDCGFDSFFGIRASTDIPPYFYIRGNEAVQPPSDRIEANSSEGWSPIQGEFWRAGGIAPDLQLKDVLPRFTDEGTSIIKRHAENKKDAQPLMLYLAYPAPHTPWLPSEAFAGKSGAGMYGDFLMMVDDQIGRVLDALRAAEMEDDTLVVFTSDNGPVWYAADTERFDHDSTGGLKGMKGDAWEAGHRMPFIARWPNRVAAGSSSEQLICFTDLLATMADLFKVPLPDEAGPDSYSFLPALTGKAAGETELRDDFVMQPAARSMMTIRQGNWKLITALGSGGFTKPSRIPSDAGDPAGQLYDLGKDLGESNNLYAAKPEIVTRLTAQLKQIVESGRSRPLAASKDVARVDPGSLDGKVMCGYQGWFSCDGDGNEMGWTHWARNPRKPFGPGNVTVDLWPDLSEFSHEEKYATGFKHVDGSVAEVYSSTNRQTVLRHFQWMQEYGIDGVFAQRFANGLKNETLKRQKDAVLENVRDGADRYGRTFAVMYDLSGLRAGEVANVWDDWRSLRVEQKITTSPGYQHHEGKPVVAVWGVGFNDDRKYSLAECHELVRRLKADGCTVMLGVPSWWREGTRDAVDDPALLEVLKLADVLSPWTIGRYRTPKEASGHAAQVWQPDQKWCVDREIDFLPVVYPGFSWHNLKGAPLDAIPRLKGEFLWSQIAAAKRIGSRMVYVAMFDEVDEGTAIFKCSNDPPVGEGVEFLTYDGLPSDHYLKLVGHAGKVLRGDAPATDTLPTLPSRSVSRTSDLYYDDTRAPAR
ncbi:Arylsulfatase [Rosistilla oblonga]|uniref:Arylsulfatase n=1 Tax=Rosistilla oblonga TaxID=2527990 RepID=A0A518J074_9BACT|nr:Arylsulfatase [Rosistilla oblonga]